MLPLLYKFKSAAYSFICTPAIPHHLYGSSCATVFSTGGNHDAVESGIVTRMLKSSTK